MKKSGKSLVCDSRGKRVCLITQALVLSQLIL